MYNSHKLAWPVLSYPDSNTRQKRKDTIHLIENEIKNDIESANDPHNMDFNIELPDNITHENIDWDIVNKSRYTIQEYDSLKDEMKLDKSCLETDNSPILLLSNNKLKKYVRDFITSERDREQQRRNDYLEYLNRQQNISLGRKNSFIKMIEQIKQHEYYGPQLNHQLNTNNNDNNDNIETIFNNFINNIK